MGSCKDQVQILYISRMFSFYLLALLLLSVHDVFGSQCRGNCGQGEGDCDNNEECQDGLWCEFDYWWGDDYCNPPKKGGFPCPSQMDSSTRTCNNGPCPVDGGFSDWDEWTPCTAECGGGDQTRSRRCDNPAPQFGGLDCVGDFTECQRCNLDPCPSTCPA